jgi:iron complex outermembrane recepter protein
MMRMTKTFFLASTFFTGAFSVCQPALALDLQDEFDSDASIQSADTTAALDIVVTGSRIPRPNLENSSPTLVLDAERLTGTNQVNIADVATQYPQFAPAFGSSRTQSTFSGAATSGLQLVNLRNLGGGRTLTLLNGRRMPGGTTTGTAVDFNTIPTANIERIELITGGASAIYGADAVAGVVNIITRRNFEGLEIGASYRITERGDDATPAAYLLFGTGFGGGGHATITAQVTRQGLVTCAERFLCAEDFFWNPPGDPIRGPAAYSGVGIGGRFFAGTESFTAAGQPFDVTVHGYNRNAQRTLAQVTDRFLIAADVSYPVSDFLNVFLEANYGLSRTQGTFEGHPFQSNAAGSLFGGGPGVPGLQPSIPIDNPFVPQWLRDRVLAANPNATSITWWDRLDPLQQRGATNERQMMRLAGGINGQFDAGLVSPLRYEVSYVHGQTTLNSLTRGLVSTMQLYHGLRVEPDPANPGQFRCIDPGARAVGCVPINPFDGWNETERRALTVDAGQSGRGQIRNAQAFIAGDLARLPGGNLGVAVGVEHRSLSGFLDYDDVINRGLVTGNQLGDTDPVTVSVNEAFIEGVAPIYGGLSWLTNITLEGAYRVSDPSRGPSYSTWRYGGAIEFIPGLRVRVMRGKAVRQPTPAELSGVGQTFGVVNDPCVVELRNANSVRAANCTADGVPADYDPPLVVRQGTGGFVGGNPDLRPEEAISLTYGIAFAPRFLPGLALTVDRFEIDLDNIITTVGRQTKLNICYDTVERLFCEDIQRGAHPLVPGNVALREVNDQLTNVAQLSLKGIDIEGRYQFGLPLLGRDGQISVQAVATIYDEALQVNLPGTDPVDLLGAAGGSTTDQGWIKFTANGNITYRLGGSSLNWNIRYIGNTRSSPIHANAVVIPAHTYHNLRFSQQVGESFEFFVGVNNLLDTAPPFFPSGHAGTQALDTVPAYYDVFGRSYYSGVRLRF